MANVTAKVIFALIALVTLAGNILVVVVFLKNRAWLKKVHTCLLLALAIQDILTAICLLTLPRIAPASGEYNLPTHPTYGQLYCSLLWCGYIAFALSVTSIYTCLMLAIDRSLAVLKPMTYRRFCHSQKCAAAMVILSWMAGFGFEIDVALDVEIFRRDDGYYGCAMRKIPSSAENTVIILFLLVGKVILPATLMTIGYVKMVLKLKETSSRVSRGAELNIRTNNSFSSSLSQNEDYFSLKRLTRMVCAASAMVVICWLPDHLFFSLYELNLVKLDDSIHNGLHILGFLNTCANPFLYSFSNNQYKNKFKKILVCLLNQHCGSPQQNDATSHSLEEIRPRPQTGAMDSPNH